eukprot:362632-Chlamydomonas_euryale.AAC.1
MPAPPPLLGCASDLDTATSSVKPSARNTRYVDASLTVPHGVLYPMSLVNVAFDREAIGVAMFPGLPGVDERPVDDSFVGLCAKVWTVVWAWLRGAVCQSVGQLNERGG